MARRCGHATAGAGCMSGKNALIKARKSAFSHAMSSHRFCPVATRTALMESPATLARRLRSSRRSDLACPKSARWHFAAAARV
jgi:hypothetical protein